MQEPNIQPLLQTISKAESPLSFLGTKHPPGPFPIRVIIGTAQGQVVSIIGGYRQVRGVRMASFGKEKRGSPIGSEK